MRRRGIAVAGKRALISAAKEREVHPDLPEVVQRYLDGESMQVLAAESGTYSRKLYRWMFSEFGGEKYRELVTECLINRISDADQEMMAARLSKDPVRVSAAREMQRFTRMDFERRRPALYGPKQEVRHSGGGVWRVEIARETGAVIENPPQAALAAPEGDSSDEQEREAA